MSRTELYSLSEVAAFLGKPVNGIRRFLGRQGVRWASVTRSGRAVRAVDHKTLVFLYWARDHHDDIKPSLVDKLYQNLIKQEGLPHRLEAGVFTASLVGAAEQVFGRLKSLRELDSQIDVNDSGEVVLKGTSVEVHRIAALIKGGMSRDDILGDYPTLNAEQVDLAEAYAAVHPQVERFYPKLTAKAAMRQADLSALHARRK